MTLGSRGGVAWEREYSAAEIIIRAARMMPRAADYRLSWSAAGGSPAQPHRQTGHAPFELLELGDVDGHHLQATVLQ